MSENPVSIPASVAGNIDTVLDLEREADHERSLVSKVAHMVGEMVGSVGFAVAHIGAFASWLLLNSGIWTRMMFDPYPFTLLGTIVSCEAVVLTTFVLIKQNRESERSERRSHLDLQVNLLTEREVTKVLQIVQQLSERAGLAVQHDPEMQELVEHTALRDLAEHLEDRHAGKRPET